MVSGAHSPKLLQLFDLIEEHRIPFTRDFRERFGISRHDIGLTVRYDEAFDLVVSLLSDPSSWLGAAVSGWKFPLTREAIFTLDLIDLLLMKWTGDQFKPVEKPWDANKPKRRGKSPEAAMRQLRPHLFKEP